MNILSLPRRELDKALNIFFYSYTDVRFRAIEMLRDGFFFKNENRPRQVHVSRTTQCRIIRALRFFEPEYVGHRVSLSREPLADVQYLVVLEECVTCTDRQITGFISKNV